MKEKHFFIFKYVNGSTQEFEQDGGELSAKIRNSTNNMIVVDNEIINLDNVIKVTVETQSQRAEAARLNAEMMGDYKF